MNVGIQGLIALLLISRMCLAQGSVTSDSIHCDPSIKMLDLNITLPVAQAFVKPSAPGAPTLIRSSMPSGDYIPDISISRNQKNQTLTAFVGMRSLSNKSIKVETFESQTGTEYRYYIEDINVVGSSDKYVWEFKPSPDIPVNFRMQLGYGSSRLDFSGLSVNSIDITSGSADMIISYTSPNLTVMSDFSVRSGASQIVIRNLDLARAKQVHVENTMGFTRILVGNQSQSQSLVRINVGAGSCELLISEEAPVKIIIHDSFLSSEEIPDNFFQSSDNIYVNKAYKTDHARAIVFEIDLGVGKLRVVNLSQ